MRFKVNPLDGQLVPDAEEGTNVSITQSGGDSSGVTSISKSGEPQLIGDVTLSAGTNVSIVQTGQNIEIAASGGGGGGAVDSVNGQTGIVVLDQDDILDGTTYKQYSQTEKTKLAGIEDGAEVNNISDANATDLTDAGDSTLHFHSADRARANHTGTQTASTISDFDTEVSNNTDVAANTAARHAAVTVGGEDFISLTGQAITAHPINLDNLSATGTPSAANFLRGDNTWATPAGSGDVSKVGTPIDNQIGVWTGDGTIEGDPNLTFDTATDTLATVNIAPSGTVDGRDIATDGTKLDTIETNADVTDAANVAAAGAYMVGGTDVALADGGTGASLVDPNADRIFFWDDSAGSTAFLTPSTGLTLSGTNLTVRTASTSQTGISETATDAEFTTGTDTTRYVTPNQVANVAQTMANKTLTTPTIANFTNATHNHTNAAGGGQITDAALSSAVSVPKGGTGNTTLTSGQYLKGNGTGAITSESAATLAATVGNLLMPVGFIYISGVSTNPNTLLGFGTWIRIEGRFIVGVSNTDSDFDLDDIGGAKTHTHGLTDGYAEIWVSDGSGRVFHKEKPGVTSWTSTTASGTSTPFTTPTSVGDATTLAGNTNSGSSLPPYIAKYVWQRAA